MEDLKIALDAIHLMATMEAVALTRSCNLNFGELHEILVGAAGNSSVFEEKFLNLAFGDFDWLQVDKLLLKSSAILAKTQIESFPLPMLAAAQQGLQIHRNLLPAPKAVDVARDMSKSKTSTVNLANDYGDFDHKSVSFVGLGAMGSGMASALLKADFAVTGFDLWQPSMDKFKSIGGRTAKDILEATQAATLVVMMVQSAAQIDSLLFSDPAVLNSLQRGSVLIVMSTVPPAYITSLGDRLASAGVEVVDAPVSGGVVRAANGDLTIMASGSSEALAKANAALVAMSGAPKNLCLISGGLGMGSSVKMLNQLLAGTHIVASAEIMALAAHNKLDTRAVYQEISKSKHTSWMFNNRVPAMLEADWTPHSSLAIWVKDMGIVNNEASRSQVPLILASTANQLYLQGVTELGSKDMDSGIVRLWKAVSVSDSAKQP